MAEPMSDRNSAAAPAAPRYRGLLVGCLGAIAIVVVLVVAGALLFRAWIHTPGLLLQGSRLVDGSTALYAEVQLRKEDQRTRDLFRAVIEAQQRQQREQLNRPEVPGPVRTILGFIPQRTPGERDIDKVLPVTLVMTRQEGTAGTDEPFLFAVSMPNAGNALRLVDKGMSFMVGRAKAKARHEQHGGEEMFYMPGKPAGMWASIVGTDVLFSRNEGQLASAIDRLGRAGSGAADRSASEIFAARPADAILFMTSKAGHSGALADALETVLPAFGGAVRRLANDAGAVTLWGRLASADTVEGEMRIREKPGSAPATDLTELAATFTVPLAAGDVTVGLAPTAKEPGERAAFRFKLDGIGVAVRSGLIELDRAGHHPGKNDSGQAAEPPAPAQPQ